MKRIKLKSRAKKWLGNAAPFFILIFVPIIPSELLLRLLDKLGFHG